MFRVSPVKFNRHPHWPINLKINSSVHLSGRGSVDGEPSSAKFIATVIYISIFVTLN